MKNMKAIVKIVLLILFLGTGTGIAHFLSLFNSAYNDITVLNEEIQTLWCQVESVYHSRKDIIPYIVAVMQEYDSDDTLLFDKILEQTAACASEPVCNGSECLQILTDHAAFHAFQNTQNMLELDIQKLFSCTARYPQLDNNIHFRVLMMHLKENTRRIIGKQKRYNILIERFNGMITTLPHSLTAWFYGFVKKEYLLIDEIEKTNVLLP